MKTLTKTIEHGDYEALSAKTWLLRSAATELSAANCVIDIGHDARFWEYGMALEALMQWVIKRPKLHHRFSIVDIGAGDSLFGPAMALKVNYGIEEIEPRVECHSNRVRCNDFLASKKAPQIRWTHGKLNGRPDKQWDAVFCISVVEHVAEQDAFWSSLSASVADNGLLFLTTDVVPDAGRSYTFDNLRAVKYTTQVLQWRAEQLLSRGFKWLGGEPDWAYHGDEVYDYSFMSLALVKG